MIKEYYWQLEGETIRKTITQDVSAQKFIEKHIAENTKESRPLSFHDFGIKDVTILTAKLNIGENPEQKEIERSI